MIPSDLNCHYVDARWLTLSFIFSSWTRLAFSSGDVSHSRIVAFHLKTPGLTPLGILQEMTALNALSQHQGDANANTSSKCLLRKDQIHFGDVIGQGAFGQVVEAVLTDGGDNKRVAVKRLRRKDRYLVDYISLSGTYQILSYRRSYLIYVHFHFPAGF